jgi:hypothetical protein
MTIRERLCLAALLLLPAAAGATPSGQIWIPSTDVQKYGTVHMNIDNYVPASREPGGAWKAPVFDMGPTAGVLDKGGLLAEAGFDVVRSGAPADSTPLYLNAKLAAPAGACFRGSPAVAAGVYGLGTVGSVTGQDATYAIAAMPLPRLGRVSAGYYVGNAGVLKDGSGRASNSGLLLSLDRAFPVISDKLWAAIDYQGGRSALGALSLGASWAFTGKTSLLLGYNCYNDHGAAGRNTFTVQVDIDLW